MTAKRVKYFFDHESHESRESGKVLFAGLARFVIQLFSENLLDRTDTGRRKYKERRV